MDKKKFVLLSTQRSGSTAFRLLLNDHPKIRCHDEVLLKESGAQDAIRAFVRQKGLEKQYKRKDYHGNSWFKKRTLYRNMTWNNTLVHANNRFTANLLRDFLTDLYTNPEHSAPWTSVDSWNDYHKNERFDSEEAIGFKLMYYELENNWLSDWIRTSDLRIIHLIRKNKLQKLISSELAKARKSWHTEDGVSSVRIKLHTAYLIDRIKQEIDEDAFWMDYLADKKTLLLYYEDFLENPQQCSIRAQEYLGVETYDLTTPLKKISGKPEDVLENFEEVRNVLRGTDYETFLTE